MDSREVYSVRVRAGKRTYIFDVRATRNQDYYITITETRRDFSGENQKQKIFLYKEDFVKFQRALNRVISHVRTDLLPDFPYERHVSEEDEEVQS
ncbi:MAG: PUR family DNA/RNA-binding protein [Bacteroidia bacterium]|nr:PUR family DNA/RNA-binding protein [Bacteroidia bacterium]